jgi:hypothetical protein
MWGIGGNEIIIEKEFLANKKYVIPRGRQTFIYEAAKISVHRSDIVGGSIEVFSTVA